MSVQLVNLKKLDSHSPEIKQMSKGWPFLSRLGLKLSLKGFEDFTQGCLEIKFSDTQAHYAIGNPNQPVVGEITIHHPEAFEKLLLHGDIGLAEGYMDGNWDTPDLEAILKWFILNIAHHEHLAQSAHKLWWLYWMAPVSRIQHWLRPNSLKGSPKNIQDHYDLGNQFFKLFLDPTLTYSSAFFENNDVTLEMAQITKYEKLCQKLKLQPSDHVLEIGSGWGGWATYAAQKYGCKVTTITLSKQQLAHVQALVITKGLQDKVFPLYKDYREVEGQFDKIVSIEMIEAVGEQYLDTYFACCNKYLKPNGLVALQMITCPDARYKTLVSHVDFIQKHIFPGTLLPSVGRMQQALLRTGELQLFEMEDMGLHYGKTLGLWDEGFLAKKTAIEKLGFDETFIRKWHYYFKYCQAAFNSRNISVVQVVLTRPNNPQLMETL